MSDEFAYSSAAVLVSRIGRGELSPVDDETVFAASGAFEHVRPWHDAYPPR